jgi:transcriptional regulator with XRE-family HTH domain
MHNLRMKNINITAMQSELLIKVKQIGITQNQLATALSVSQSQISRVLSGQGKRRTKLFDELCIYVNNQTKGISSDVVRQNEDLMQAIASVWDGSVAQAKTIATVIKSLGPFCKTAVFSEPTITLKDMSK